ncbi:Ig-like domain-containing protein [[Eubacterium] cellulosolvens]
MIKSKTNSFFMILILLSSLLIALFPGIPGLTTAKPPKVISSAPSALKLAEDAAPSFIDLYDIYDGSGGALNFTLWTGSSWGFVFNNNNLTVTIESNDTIKFDPEPNMYGVDKITVNATNSAGSTNHIITVTINPVNDPPVIDMIGNIKVGKSKAESIFVYQDEWYNATVTAYDVDGDKIIYLDNSSLFDINYLTGNITFRPTQKEVGIHYVNITASDINGSNYEDWVNIKFTILNINDPPIAVIHYPENGTTIYSEKYMIFEGEGLDPDATFGDKLSYMWYSDIDGELGDEQNIEIYYLSEGIHKITLNVTDSLG